MPKFYDSLFFKTEKNLLLSFKNQEILLLKVKKIFFLNLTVSLWGPPSQGTVFHTIFPGKIFYVKRPQLSDAPKIRTIIPSSWPWGGCRQLSRVLHLRVPAFIQVNIFFLSSRRIYLWSCYQLDKLSGSVIFNEC